MISGQINRIVFFGTEDFSAISLRALIAAGFDIAAVVTKPDSKKGRGHKLVPPTVKVIAEAHDIPVWQPAKLSDITDAVKALQPATGVLVSFGKIIPQSTIDLFTPGIINVHPSRLPQYRGPSPIESAILYDDDETGVSIMQLSAQMDAGPVYSYAPILLNGTETAPELYKNLGEIGATMLTQLLPGIISGDIVGAPQDDTQATYCQLIQKSDGVINWSKPAAQIEREIRAYQSWPQSRTTIGGIDVIITDAHASTTPDQLALQCGDNNYLIINEIKPIGKKEMPLQAFLAGYKDRLSL